MAIVPNGEVNVVETARYSQRKRPVQVYVDAGPLEIITEQGYMKTKDQIKRFMEAGVVLQNFKRGDFDKVQEDG